MAEVIAAIASPVGTGAISLIRLSGDDAKKVAQKVVDSIDLPRARQAAVRKIRDKKGRVLDEGVMVIFEGPGSYTGEDVVEFSGHGGVVVTRAVLERFVEAGARPAEPGEFTQRAYLNGKLDLTQAEAVMDLISAQTKLALRSANEQLSGRLGRVCEEIRARLLSAVAHMEAYLDFPEEDIDPVVGASLQRKVEEQQAAIGRLLATAEQGKILRDGVRTVIFGRPNVGKSSLLNRLLGYQRAIVSDREGTTRDTIEEVINLRGIPLRLIDTAGVRESEDEIEQEGIAMTFGQIERADLILEVVDLSQAPDHEERNFPEGVHHLRIGNKSDSENQAWSGSSILRISCETGEGFEALEGEIVRILSLDETHWGDHSVAVNVRHQACLQRAKRSLELGLESLQRGDDAELSVMDLREALNAIGEVAGVVDTEEILGEIFGNFCIGK